MTHSAISTSRTDVHNVWATTRLSLALVCLALLGSVPLESVRGQEATIAPPAVSSGLRESLKPLSRSELSSPAGEAVQTLSATARGDTYVALASGLDSVFRGGEPRSLAELKLLELQQSKVASVIERVTVNVQQGSAQGSGVLITADGYVLTAAHVAGKPNMPAQVVFSDGTRYSATTLGMNRDKDAGLLKINDERGQPWPFATIGSVGDRDLREGQWVVAAGHPGGWKAGRGAVIRVGRVLAINRSTADRGRAHTLFTDCALIGGDSGGPLFTLEGKLVGIHSRIGTEITDNMHVPIDVFHESWERMVRGDAWGSLPGYRPVIGVNGPKGDDRPLIDSVVPRSPAARGGLAAGDLVLSINGVNISTFEELKLGVEASLPGDVLVLTVQREAQVLRLSITVGVADN
ncbi:S1C family serine protease [Aureliella helgolandensis]|uniref:Putative periplasmic serine endoprotease DegP-like n=1 Tax=Aureliella helgolandensis TaxID=2527968 RepID=A0A518GAQ6_9BACT|nr:trypsin-like peptidase domain-containing protein [Aureliella helgolandensis]QDV25620.1 putative periplasmic serine endoprotease DegP-like precursor [Aureliella helgolandensis]